MKFWIGAGLILIAAAGAALVLKAGVPWALALATVLLAASGAVVYRLHGSPAR